ncbi:MAG: acetylxylan esterase [Bryobacteraceae bacterium]|nr:acetylxylan esterase [Bryobacteraceae bacterium]
MKIRKANLMLAGGMVVYGLGVAAVAQGPAPWSANPKVVEELGRKRPGINYDESKVPAYELPDALKTSSGARVTSPAMWERQRRGELLEIFRSQFYGRRPETKYIVKFQLVSEVKDAFDGAATGRDMMATVSIGERKFEFPFTVFLPNKAKGKAPAVVHINNRYPLPVKAVIEKHDPFWPVRTLIERGYATASFHTSHVDPDRKDGYDKGIRAFFANGQPQAADGWGALSSWGWGASRLLDYLATVPGVDATRVAVSGHSRGGKASLWAASEDTRFAIAYSNDSGCMGAAISRRKYGETVEVIAKAFPHWFCSNINKYAGKESDLPVDQHELIALVAPRAVYVASADEDLWADPKGEYGALVAASPVFGLFGKQAVSQTDMPALLQPRHVGSTGYHIRPGGHGLDDRDWGFFLDFAGGLLKR